MISIRKVGVIAAGASICAASVGASVARQRQLPVADGRAINNISCDAMEGSRIHIHQHLVIIDRGRYVSIPATVGQVPARRCLYWVHTHTPDGIIHIEAPQDRTFKLGDFFAIWGQPLSRTQASTALASKGSALKVWVNGKPFTGDPATIPLDAHADIVIEAGPPYSPPPRFTDWNGM